MFSLVWYFLAALPESLLLVFSGTLLLGLEFRVRDAIIAGIILSWLTVLIRSDYVMHYIKFGVHTIIITCLLIILNTIILRGRITDATLAGLISVFLVALADHLLLGPIMCFFDLSLENILKNNILRIIMNWVELTFLILAVYLARFKKVKINLKLNR